MVVMMMTILRRFWGDFEEEEEEEDNVDGYDCDDCDDVDDDANNGDVCDDDVAGYDGGWGGASGITRGNEFKEDDGNDDNDSLHD